MIEMPERNFITRPYRGLSVQEVVVPLTEAELTGYLLGREVYRRTDYLVLRNAGRAAVLAVRKQSAEPLFSPVTEVRLLAGPAQTVEVISPGTDAGNATALALAAAAHARPGALAYVVQGRYEHINLIWDPAPVQVRVTEVIPPSPPKLVAMAEQAAAFDDDLPPLDLVPDLVDIRELAAEHPAPSYLLPCRGAGVDVGAATGASVAFLDTRPAQRQDWLMVGCERSVQFHRHFYGDEPERADICPRRRVAAGAAGDGMLTLTKCCLIERGIEVSDGVAVVPWGSNLDEVRLALRLLTGLPPVSALAPAAATIQASGHAPAGGR